MHVFVHGACSEFDYVFCTCLGLKGFACSGRRCSMGLSDNVSTCVAKPSMLHSLETSRHIVPPLCRSIKAQPLPGPSSQRTCTSSSTSRRAGRAARCIANRRLRLTTRLVFRCRLDYSSGTPCHLARLTAASLVSGEGNMP